VFTLVEEALKKIFTDQQFGIHNPQKTESWVRFTLGMIQKELKNRGRSRDKKQIKHAIEVMSSCENHCMKNSTYKALPGPLLFLID
jgi:formyltetrahydrofolate hydrolase